MISRTRSRTARLSRFFWPSGSLRVWFHGRVTTRRPKRQSSGHARCVFLGLAFHLCVLTCNPVDGEACDSMRALRSAFVPLISARLTFLFFSFSIVFLFVSSLDDIPLLSRSRHICLLFTQLFHHNHWPSEGGTIQQHRDLYKRHS